MTRRRDPPLVSKDSRHSSQPFVFGGRSRGLESDRGTIDPSGEQSLFRQRIRSVSATIVRASSLAGLVASVQSLRLRLAGMGNRRKPAPKTTPELSLDLARFGTTGSHWHEEAQVHRAQPVRVEGIAAISGYCRDRKSPNLSGFAYSPPMRRHRHLQHEGAALPSTMQR